MEKNEIQVHTRTMEIGVNACLHVLGSQLSLNNVEIVLSLGEALKFAEQKTGLKFTDLIQNFSPDKAKLDLV